ncbi:MAG TPA: COX15/CtaA family protein [Micromonosporaceae bacterium]
MSLVTGSDLPPSSLVRRLALASVVANVLIVITGGAVRLTGSGLGCPTWPRCTDESYVNTTEMGVHGLIEFGNRVLSVLVGVIAVAALVAVFSSRSRARGLAWPATAVVALVGVQGVVGGWSVRVNLNPWVVAAHFTMSMVLIAVAYTLWARADIRPGPAWPALPRELRWLVTGIAATTLAVLAVGTVVTGSGPHAGDPDSPRIQIDSGMLAQLHADLVFLLIGMSVAAWLALRAVGAPRPVVRAATVLLGAELAQGLIGFVQYFTALPVLLVGIHMAGACAVWLAALNLFHTTRTRPTTPVTPATEKVPAGVGEPGVT